jgi:hypothetical protein
VSDRIFKTGDTIVTVARDGATNEERKRAFEAIMSVHAGGVIVLPASWKVMDIDELRAEVKVRVRSELIDVLQRVRARLLSQLRGVSGERSIGTTHLHAVFDSEIENLHRGES